jgi:hypothetical protein
MAEYVSEMFDELRQYLDDTDDSVVSFAIKKQWLNRGIRMMFPRIYQRYAAVPEIDSEAAAFAEDTYTYEFESVPGDGIISAIQTVDPDTDVPVRLNVEDYEVIPGTTLYVQFTPTITTYYDLQEIRVIGAIPITPIAAANYTAAQSEVWTGPAGTLGIPVYYAMSMAAAIPLDDRLKYDQASVVMQQGAASPSDIMSASVFWLDKFNFETDQQMMPTPASRY